MPKIRGTKRKLGINENQFKPDEERDSKKTKIENFLTRFVEFGKTEGGHAFGVHYMSYSSDYISNAFIEGQLGVKSNSYEYVKWFDSGIDSVPILQTRYDKDTKTSEIVYIKAGKFISGSDLKNAAIGAIKDKKYKKIYINDDAKFPILSKINNDGTKEYKEISMRQYLPFVSEDARTWYEKSGFKPVNCTDVKSITPGNYITQDIGQYYASVHKVRCTTLDEFCKFQPSRDKTTLKHLEELAKRYLSNTDWKHYTIHQLGNAIYKYVKNSDLRDHYKLLVTKDFLKFNDWILKVRKTKNRHKEGYQKFHKALDIVRVTCLWEKIL